MWVYVIICIYLTIQQFINEHKIVFDILLGYFSKIWMHHIDDFEKKFKHHGCINILLGDCRQPDISSLRNFTGYSQLHSNYITLWWSMIQFKLYNYKSQLNNKQPQIHTLIWKKLVRAIFVTGDRTCCRAWITLTRNASTAFRPMSSRYTREMSTSPLWLYTKRPPIIVADLFDCTSDCDENDSDWIQLLPFDVSSDRNAHLYKRKCWIYSNYCVTTKTSIWTRPIHTLKWNQTTFAYKIKH